MNSNKALTFDTKMTFAKKSALPTVSWTTLVMCFYPLPFSFVNAAAGNKGHPSYT
ncbi:MAG: hypothetical protein GQ529_00930 [Methyloprofundus sp.]|nr:hypothetical protein [Methyloprofundus sp.]